MVGRAAGPKGQPGKMKLGRCGRKRNESGLRWTGQGNGFWAKIGERKGKMFLRILIQGLKIQN
jgi:hypothetical protein